MITCKCGEPAVVQWRRRPTEAELASARTAESARRASSAPSERVQAPLPSAADTTLPVYACADHALTPALAALVHRSACSGPDKAGACDCTPEPAPAADFPEDPAKPKRRLPKGW